MRDFFKNNKLASLALAVTILLGIISVLTAIRFYQLRKQAVAPTSPEEPQAAVAGQACQTFFFRIATPTPTPTRTPTPTPSKTPTPTATPTPPPTAQCKEIKAYDTNWNLLSISQLENLGPGSKVRFTVIGSTSAGIFDKAKFSINGVGSGELTQKKPGTEEFYFEYTLQASDAGKTLTVEAWVHHAGLNQWF